LEKSFNINKIFKNLEENKFNLKESQIQISKEIA
jgi:hypothetical protein